jgi:hypothetical protein
MSEKTVDEWFDRLEKKITGMVTIWLSAMGLVLVVMAIFISAQQTAVSEIRVEQNEQSKQVIEFKRDFGTILLIAPADHRKALMFDDLTNKYNPNRGGKQ